MRFLDNKGKLLPFKRLLYLFICAPLWRLLEALLTYRHDTKVILEATYPNIEEGEI